MLVVLDHIEGDEIHHRGKCDLERSSNAGREIIGPNNGSAIIDDKEPPQFWRIFPGTPTLGRCESLPYHNANDHWQNTTEQLDFRKSETNIEALEAENNVKD